MMGARLRPVESEADLEAHVAVWNAITPDDPAAVEQQRERDALDPRRLKLLAEEEGRVVGCGFAGPSDSPGRGALSPRVLPAARRRGVGSMLLQALSGHLEALGSASASALVDGEDEGSLAFAAHLGFQETDRQVEQVWTSSDDVSADPPPGVRFVTVAERPGLLREAHSLATEGYADMATSMPVTVSLEDWLREEATLPEGSFVAIAGDEIVGYSGLCLRPSSPGIAEDGLTVVRRDWRRRGLATALKRAELSWAGAHGVREIVTWTQRGNDGMRAVNERLGYVYRSVVVTVNAPLPLS